MVLKSMRSDNLRVSFLFLSPVADRRKITQDMKAMYDQILPSRLYIYSIIDLIYYFSRKRIFTVTRWRKFKGREFQ